VQGTRAVRQGRRVAWFACAKTPASYQSYPMGAGWSNLGERGSIPTSSRPLWRERQGRSDLP
jgi:hypothetical protein